MSIIDIAIFATYFLTMLGVGVYFMRKNESTEDYYVGGRSMGAWHVGMSVVATDVGGGFSIGLGGLGFMIGVSGSWMLFTGLIGAWISAIFLIPKVSKIGREVNLFTFPQVFDYFFNKRVGLIAGIISAIGYVGFTSSQILAGAKLASATFNGLTLTDGILLMGLIAVIYTVLGGIKAVIYTDTIQWAVLIFGLVGIGIPLGYTAIGGWDSIVQTVEPEMLSLTNIHWQDLVNWAVTIIPIWFVGMTLYQRIYACKSEKEAKKAWFIAGLLEYPIMAFMGVLLGLFARVAFMQGMFAEFGYTHLESLDAEMGLPIFLKTILPFGLLGLMLSAYFSAIMSTADSCLMAASGNVVTDIIERFFKIEPAKSLRLSQWATLAIGVLAIILAASMTNVLELMLLSYAFMVSGLFVPIIGALYWKQSSSVGAILAMIGGGLTTISLSFSGWNLPLGLDPNVFGISVSLVLFVGGSSIWGDEAW
ncbi:sodium:solute symporter family protein [bacterium]|nr:MAG: sodium:solute symporter family protein [bacterium]